MASGVLSLPVDVPWQLIAASPDMMDNSFCNKNFPFEWRSSVAISAYEPAIDQLPPDYCEGRVTMLKITTSITGYQPSKAETDAAYAEFPNVPTEDMTRIIGTYWACWGALLNVAVFAWPHDADAPLSRYPHIIGLQPQARDLYQVATEMGEVLTASRSDVNVGKSHGTTENTEMGLDLHSDYSSGQTPYGIFQGGWKATKSWGNTASDSSAVQHDASRESRETVSTTTNISQMYNLLTGYHLGTNRATFLMLPRPHTLQATNLRTFIHGLRVIEGIQEFFLIVSRPKGVEGLGVEVRLETGHFPEEVTSNPPPAKPPSQEEFTVNVTSQACGPTQGIDTTYTILAPGYVIDHAKGDPGHPGVSEVGSENPKGSQEDMTIGASGSKDFKKVNDFLDNYDYRAADNQSVKVFGNLRSGCWWPAANHYSPHLIRKFRVFTKSTDVASGPVQTNYLITGRSLCAAFLSTDTCVTPVSGEELANLTKSATSRHPVSILDEQMITISSVVSSAEEPGFRRQPALKELLRKLHKTMSTSWRLPTRRPPGELGFLDTDYFKDQIRSFIPDGPILNAAPDANWISAEILQKFARTLTVRELLDLDLLTFAKLTGQQLPQAATVRRALLRNLLSVNTL